jgi:MFS family permease
MLGAVAAPRLARRLGYGRSIVAVSAVTIPPVLAIAATDGPLWTLLAVWSVVHVVTGLGVGLVNVMIFTMRARMTPDHLLGRVGASTRLLVFGALPLGALLGGLLADRLGNQPSMWLTAVWQVASISLLWRLWRLDDAAEPSTWTCPSP